MEDTLNTRIRYPRAIASRIKPLALALMICSAMFADVAVSTSLNMSSLAITADIGTVQLSLSPGAFGDVYDTLGDYNYALNFSDDPATASASVPLASISDFATVAGGLGVTARSGVNIAGVTAQAGTETANYGSIAGTFEIVDPSASAVNVTFTALLNASQSLLTTTNGLSVGQSGFRKLSSSLICRTWIAIRSCSSIILSRLVRTAASPQPMRRHSAAQPVFKQIPLSFPH